PKDSFTGEEIPKGKGLMYVLKDGTIYWFKNKKSEKNLVKLKRLPSKTKWTMAYEREKKTRLKEKKGAN
ncbi:MAG: 50S ribosomal protein L24e, partial [Candidatus Diapherotrites archaeon]